MKLYSAIVYVGRTPYVFQFQAYHNKAEFVADLRKRGFKVNPLLVKPSNCFATSSATLNTIMTCGSSAAFRKRRCSNDSR